MCESLYRSKGKAGTGRDRKGWSQRQETGRQRETLKGVRPESERLLWEIWGICLICHFSFFSVPSYFYVWFHTEIRVRTLKGGKAAPLFPSIPVVFCEYGQIINTFCSCSKNSRTSIMFRYRSNVMAVWYWQWTKCWNICSPILSKAFHKNFQLLPIAVHPNVCLWRTVNMTELC